MQRIIFNSVAAEVRYNEFLLTNLHCPILIGQLVHGFKEIPDIWFLSKGKKWDTNT